MKCSFIRCILSVFLAVVIIFSLAVSTAAASSVPGEYVQPSDVGLSSIISNWNLSNAVGADLNKISFAVQKETLINRLSAAKKMVNSVSGNWGAQLLGVGSYGYDAAGSSGLGDFFRCSSIDAVSAVYYRIDVSEVQYLSDSIKVSIGGWLKGYYVASVGGYVYQYVFPDTATYKSSDYFGISVYLNRYVPDFISISGWVDLVVDGLFQQSRFLTASNGRLIVGVQSSSAATTENNYYNTTNKTEISVDQDNQYEVNINDSGNTTNTAVLDLSGMQYLDFSNMTYSPIDNLIYNAGDKSYTVNNYYTFQFYYNYTYYIQIGASAEYVGAYEVYFELPDGRNSKDLTADEIYGLSLDVGWCNFDVANENPNLLGLWPMDGMIDNVAAADDYPLNWVKNASSTYLETDNFGGALYIPYATPPSTTSNSGITNGAVLCMGSGDSFSSLGDYTLQYRLYIAGNFSNYGSGPSSSSSSRIYNILNLFSTSSASIGTVTPWGRKSSQITLYATGAGTCAIGFYGATVHNTSSFSVSGIWVDLCFEYVASEDYLYIWVNGFKVGAFSLDGSSFYPSIFQADIMYSGSGANDFGYYQLDNMRLLSGCLYDPSLESIPVAGQPFDSNKVLVLPDDTSDLTAPTIAVYSDIPVADTRFGGIRQSIPSTGDVYCYVQNNRITSIQQYDGSGWLEVGGMIWTGTRWVDPGAYDVVNYVDLFDVIDDDQVIEAVQQSNSLLASILEVLTAFRDGVFSRLDSLGGGGDDIDINQDNDIVVLPDTDPDDDEDDSVSLWDLLKTGVNLGVKMLSTLWTSGISDSLDNLDEGLNGISGFGDFDITGSGGVSIFSNGQTDESGEVGVINIWGY